MGINFRSKLEAKWAAVFTEMGIKWLYEPDKYRIGENEWYIPDFYLPDEKIFIEIKPIVFSIRRPLNFYLAGKVADVYNLIDVWDDEDDEGKSVERYRSVEGYRTTQWRNEILNGSWEYGCRNDILKILPYNYDNYCGPWYVDNDGHGRYYGEIGDHGYDDKKTCFQQCIMDIIKSDVVIAYLQPGCHGTIFELGYARALGKKIHIITGNIDKNEMWFPLHGADVVTNVNIADYYRDNFYPITWYDDNPRTADCKNAITRMKCLINNDYDYVEGRGLVIYGDPGNDMCSLTISHGQPCYRFGLSALNTFSSPHRTYDTLTKLTNKFGYNLGVV